MWGASLPRGVQEQPAGCWQHCLGGSCRDVTDTQGSTPAPGPALLRCLGLFGSGIDALSQKLERAFIWILLNLKIFNFLNQKLLLLCFVRKCGNTLLLYKTMGKARSLLENYS